MGLTICPYLVAVDARGGRTVGGLGRGVEGEAPSPLGRGANTHAPQCNGACTSPHQLAVTPVMTEAYSKSSGVRQGQEGGGFEDSPMGCHPGHRVLGRSNCGREPGRLPCICKGIEADAQCNAPTGHGHCCGAPRDRTVTASHTPRAQQEKQGRQGGWGRGKGDEAPPPTRHPSRDTCTLNHTSCTPQSYEHREARTR